MNRVAVLISGQMRTADVCFPSIKKWVLSAFAAHDVFAHIADDDDKGKLELFAPRAAVVENPSGFDEKNYCHRTGRGLISPISSVLSQFYRLKKAFELMLSAERSRQHPYDYCVRLRPDSQFFSGVEGISAGDSAHVRIPRFGSAWGYNDRFAFGTRTAMESYFTCFDSIDALVESGGVFHPESILKWKLDADGVRVVRTDALFDIVRKDGSRAVPTWNPGHGDELPAWRSRLKSAQ